MSTAEPARLRVVFDTNIYVSAFTHSLGTPALIWSEAQRRQFFLLISPAIISELAGVLKSNFGWEEANIIHRLKTLTKAAEIVKPNITLRVVAGDPDDDRIVECAVAGRADLIVSGDRHLRRLKSYQGIGIITAADLKRTLGL